MGNITYIDVFLIIPIIWFAYKGFSKGFVIELASLAALVLGLFVASHFSDYTATFLTEELNFQSEYIHIVSFALTFILVVIAMHLVGRLVETVVKAVMLGFLNKLAGAVFGILKIALLISGLFYVLTTVGISDNLISKDTKEKSVLYQPVASLIYIIMPAIESVDWESNGKGKENQDGKQKKKKIKGTDLQQSLLNMNKQSFYPDCVGYAQCMNLLTSSMVFSSSFSISSLRFPSLKALSSSSMLSTMLAGKTSYLV